MESLHTLAALPLVIVALLLEISVGGFALLVFIDGRENGADATSRGEESPARNFVRTGSWVVLLLGLLAVGASIGLSVPQVLIPPGFDARWSGAAVALSIAFVLVVAVYTWYTFNDRPLRRRLIWGVLGCALGLAALLGNALQDGGMLRGGALSLGWAVTAVALGSILMATVLGHGYLVTPKLSERPLVELIRIGLLAEGAQALLLAVALLQSGGTLLGSPALWMRLLLGLAMPVAMNVAALSCARMRSMQSATGLLYISMSLMLAGDIPSKVLILLGRTAT